jgi:hypothetical protein
MAGIKRTVKLKSAVEMNRKERKEHKAKGLLLNYRLSFFQPPGEVWFSPITAGRDETTAASLRSLRSLWLSNWGI